MNPTVSILVPNFNHARYLPKRLDTIFAQTYRDFEVIALDDRSSDDSRQVLQNYAAKAPLRLLFNEENSGSPFIQWQRGAMAATGKYLWIAESDDYAAPAFLERLVPILDARPEVGLVYCQSSQVSAAGEVGESCEVWNRSLHPTRWTADYQNSGKDEIARYMVVYNTIPNASAVLCRRDVLLNAVQGSINRRLSGDWWTWIHMLLQSDIAFVSERLNYFRVHSQSVRATTRLAAACAEDFSLQAYVCENLPIAWPDRARAFRASYAKWHRSVRSPQQGRDRVWSKRVRSDAVKVYPPGLMRMAASSFKVSAEQFFRMLVQKGPTHEQ